MEIVRKDIIRNKDIVITLKCEKCGRQKQTMGYDDNYFLNIIVPSIKCECEEKNDK
jgi:hypothetical protein